MALTRAQRKAAYRKEGIEEYGFTGAELENYVSECIEDFDKEEEKEEKRRRRERERERRRDEREREERAFKLEMKRLEVAAQAAAPAPPVPTGDAMSRKIKDAFAKFKNFETGDNMDEYISRFEKVCTEEEIPQNRWIGILSKHLSGDAAGVYDRMTLGSSYEDLKLALLRRFQLNEDGFRRKFKKFEKRKENHGAKEFTGWQITSTNGGRRQDTRQITMIYENSS